MKYTIVAYVAILNKPRSKPIVIRIATDRGYVWDGVFEDAHERFGFDSIPEGPTRAALKKAAQKLGYDVHAGTLAIP